MKFYPWNLYKKIFIITSALENCESFLYQKVEIGQLVKNFPFESNPPYGDSTVAPVQYVFITCPVNKMELNLI